MTQALAERPPPPTPEHDVRRIFEAHGDFVWRALARSGVRDADLRDATQEVFIVVARKLVERDETSSLTTWLYGIAVRVAANYRRKAHRRHEELTDELPEAPPSSTRRREDPERAFANEEARLRLARILDELPIDQRMVFVMFELDEMTCPAIAESLGIPLGTVYTRLRAARAGFEDKARRAAEGA
jgi:RNA polymerase sigma-70 factor (ECF subfamily)